jgi:hypothetical protein
VTKIKGGYGLRGPTRIKAFCCCCYSALRARACQTIVGPIPTSKDRSKRPSGQITGYVCSARVPLTVVGFPDRGYRYKSAATKIPHAAGWHRSQTGQKILPHWDRTSAASRSVLKAERLKPRDHRGRDVSPIRPYKKNNFYKKINFVIFHYCCILGPTFSLIHNSAYPKI